jgi:hypothetical protein
MLEGLNLYLGTGGAAAFSSANAAGVWTSGLRQASVMAASD